MFLSCLERNHASLPLLIYRQPFSTDLQFRVGQTLSTRSEARLNLACGPKLTRSVIPEVRSISLTKDQAPPHRVLESDSPLTQDPPLRCF